MRDIFVGSRRQLFGNAGRGVLAGWLGRIPVLAAPRAETNIYQRIGVQPVINCKGTFTITGSGSQILAGSEEGDGGGFASLRPHG